LTTRWHGVPGHGPANGARRVRLAELLGNPLVRSHLAVGDLRSDLKGRAIELRDLGQIHRDREERPIAGQILRQLFPRLLEEVADPSCLRVRRLASTAPEGHPGDSRRRCREIQSCQEFRRIRSLELQGNLVHDPPREVRRFDGDGDPRREGNGGQTGVQ
jgi:hypothetical protein